MNSKPLLILSLVVNLALAGGLVVAVKSKPQTQTTPNIAQDTATPKAELTPVAMEKVEPVTNTVAVATKAFDWRLVESDDYKKYIANLRSIGCPDETIGDIIKADVDKLYDAKRKQLTAGKKKFEYWKPGGIGSMMMDPEIMEKERALNKEKRALLTELLGKPPEEKPELLAGAAGQIEAMFDFLPAEKRSKVFEAMQEMQVKMQKSMKGGSPDPDDVRKAMKETEATIAALLTPEELLDYQLRFSMTANSMRMQLAGFEPNEKEFLDIFKMRKAYDDDYGSMYGMGNQTKAEKEKADVAKKELDTHIKELLGDTRYAEYERGQDWTFQNIYRTADKNGLGKDSAVKVYDMKKTAEDQAKAVRADKSMSPEQRSAALAGIRTETENGIKQVFGETAGTSYINNNNTWWVRNISPDPKPKE